MSKPKYEVKKGIPGPPDLGREGPALKYPFPFMEVGDCFDVPINGDMVINGSNVEERSVKRLRAAVKYHQDTKGTKYSIRTMRDETSEHEFGIVRCWRIK